MVHHPQAMKVKASEPEAAACSFAVEWGKKLQQVVVLRSRNRKWMDMVSSQVQ